MDLSVNGDNVETDRFSIIQKSPSDTSNIVPAIATDEEVSTVPSADQGLTQHIQPSSAGISNQGSPRHSPLSSAPHTETEVHDRSSFLLAVQEVSPCRHQPCLLIHKCSPRLCLSPKECHLNKHLSSHLNKHLSSHLNKHLSRHLNKHLSTHLNKHFSSHPSGPHLHHQWSSHHIPLTCHHSHLLHNFPNYHHTYLYMVALHCCHHNINWLQLALPISF